MLKPLHLNAYYTNDAEKQFFTWLSEAFSHLFQLQLSADRTVTGPYFMIFHDGDELLINDNDNNLLITVPHDYAQNSPFIISLNKELFTFYHRQLTFYDHYPLKLTYYDANGQLIYENKGFDGQILPFKMAADASDLEPWILEKITATESHQLTISIPSSSFSQILLQHYQGLLSQDGQLLGVLAQVIDLTPLLATYLEESGQALVGWSDTTSGASISD